MSVSTYSREMLHITGFLTPTIPSDTRLGWNQKDCVFTYSRLVMENKDSTCVMNSLPGDCEGEKEKSVVREEIGPDPNLPRCPECSKKRIASCLCRRIL